MVRGFRDRDYLETLDNLLFAVIGNEHPDDRVLAYLKYLPNPRGRWGKPGNRYARSTRYYSAANMMKTVEFLRKRYPQYVFHNQTSGITFSAVPHERIAIHHRPEERLAELRHASHLDRLERKTMQLASLLSNQSGVSPEQLGVTGSILLNIHTNFSDIDLTIYGVKEARRIKETLLALYDSSSTVHRFVGATLAKWCREQSSVHPLTISEAAALYARSWNKGVFENTAFSIHPVKVEQEVEFSEELYKPKGIVEISARVLDSSDSYFLPATYLVADVRPEQSKFSNVTKVVSYEGLYGGVACEGDTIIVKGKLEEVFDLSGSLRYRRILVGSAEALGSDFIKVKNRGQASN